LKKRRTWSARKSKSLHQQQLLCNAATNHAENRLMKHLKGSYIRQQILVETKDFATNIHLSKPALAWFLAKMKQNISSFKVLYLGVILPSKISEHFKKCTSSFIQIDIVKKKLIAQDVNNTFMSYARECFFIIFFILLVIKLTCCSNTLV
jgi:hypothetical protein